MTKEFLAEKLDNGFSYGELAKLLNEPRHRIVTACKKYDLKSKRLPNNIKYERGSMTKQCGYCKEIKDIDQFTIKPSLNNRPSSYCKSCNNKHTVKYAQKFKQKCLEYKGGKCEFCGYNKCASAMEFHHIDPAQKDFGIGVIKMATFNKKITDELDKCILLCVNCHREEHERLESIK